MLLCINAGYWLRGVKHTRSDRIRRSDRWIEWKTGEEVIDKCKISFSIIRVNILPTIIGANNHIQAIEIKIDTEILIKLLRFRSKIILAYGVDAAITIHVCII